VDQWLALAIVDDARWRSLRDAMGDPAWARDERYATTAGRREEHDRIDHQLAAWTRLRDLDEVVELLVAHGVPAAPVASGLDLADNPQLRARGYYEEVSSPVIGRHPVSSLPFRFASREGGWIRSPAPTLGQHTEEVLRELAGVDAARLRALADRKVVGNRPLGL
jgi:crotonobetainyl-CoA:carnitine CoA-transferase CaiB-like acyl-CoA transferase